VSTAKRDQANDLVHLSDQAVGRSSLRSARAADALGWEGHLVSGVRLLGTEVDMIVSIDHATHQRRRTIGAATPMLDSDVLSMWEWPEAVAVALPSVVSLVGVIATTPGRGAPLRAVATARDWGGFAASAVLLNPTETVTERLLLECTYSGLGVVAVSADGAGMSVVRHGRAGRADGARRTGLDRWVEEHLYGRLLADAVLT
jgi:hypothetical protein